MDATQTDDESLVGDVAHIVAESPDGPRGESELSLEERDLSANLLLLCKIHHKLVDDQPNTYTRDLLHEYKRDQEARIRAASSPEDLALRRAMEMYASFVEDWTDLSQVESWRMWTSYMLSADGPSMSVETADRLSACVDWIFARVWPRRFLPLEAAFDTFMRVLADMLRQFHKHSVKRENWWYTDHFYKISDWNPELYHKIADAYDEHVHLVEDLVLELTRAANLVCDAIRLYLDPSFRMREGTLIVTSGPYSDFAFCTHRVEYQAGERSDHPYPGLEAFRTARFERDFHFGRPPAEDNP